MKEALQIFPKAKTYYDCRQCLDRKNIDAVIICTTDHHHAFFANWALNRNMHVYCEKPPGITVEEVRTVRANYNRRKAKLATQHGTQRHAYPNFERLRELILDGAIGELKTIHSWDARQLPRPGYPAGEGMPPAALLGQMGDMGAHTIDYPQDVASPCRTSGRIRPRLNVPQKRNFERKRISAHREFARYCFDIGRYKRTYSFRFASSFSFSRSISSHVTRRCL
jgi:predicted dehydrogenase